MNRYYMVFGKSGSLVTRLPINQEVPDPLPEGTFLVGEEVWLRSISENDGEWARSDDGEIIKIPFPEAVITREDVESMRLRAYADPLTGSDRLFSESTRMQIMGEAGFEDVRARAISRFEEIQAQYPWPTE